MVHRPTRTSRCLTCTRRKVKCDGERPFCRRCRDGPWQCDGYKSQTTFVDESTRFRGGKTATPSPVVDQEPSRRTRNVWPSQRPVKLPHQRRPPEHHLIRNPPIDGHVIFVTYFLSRMSCSAQFAAPEHLNQVPQGLTTDVINPQNPSLQALSAVYFGKHRRDRGIYDRGMRLYSRAMSHLRQALQNPEQVSAIDTLVSTVCLCLLENVVFSAPLAWLRHYEGVAQLLKLQGPRTYETDFERSIARYCRFLAILSTGHLRKPCFLSGPEWKASQQPPDGATHSPLDFLLDIFADVPSILHDSDRLLESGVGVATEDFEALRYRTQSVLTQLHEWPRHLTQHLSPSPEDPAHVTDLPPQMPCDAVSLAICNAVLLCLIQQSKMLSLPLFPEGAHGLTPNQSSPPSNNTCESSKALAVEICHLATSALRGEKSMGMAFALIFPLQIASCHLEPFTPEATRLEGIMDCVVGETHGIEMGRRRDWGDILPGHGAAEILSRNFLKAKQ